jgi:hypothetical protein
VAEVVAEIWPEIIDQYNCTKLPTRPIGAFHSLVVNEYADTNIHIDKDDVKWGLCVVLPFGPFSAGRLIFPDLSWAVNLGPGDLMVFPSARYYHGNDKVKGERHSLVFHCTAADFHPPYKGLPIRDNK